METDYIITKVPLVTIKPKCMCMCVHMYVCTYVHMFVTFHVKRVIFAHLVEMMLQVSHLEIASLNSTSKGFLSVFTLTVSYGTKRTSFGGMH